ncbi:hypothetical protein SAMN02799620_01789 [Mycolicibacterium fluoranthenivorans]|uniref:Uncharacterized protein n=1 Tax=Mycolicibacterium fluoranthenivorans TaxID=258505 RepID=A0A1G4VXD8_9MYCO|nr:hypothetical protein SAMN02799620_01789 [Mycolicibacterium fluoranthenivorans]
MASWVCCTSRAKLVMCWAKSEAVVVRHAMASPMESKASPIFAPSGMSWAVTAGLSPFNSD